VVNIKYSDTMIYEDFLKQIHRRIAIISVGGSAIRNQGAAGLVDIARGYFENSISLEKFFVSLKEEGSFKRFLDSHTDQLVDQFPKGGKSWGAARKGLNLFFRDLVYNKFIAEKYGLARNFERFNEEVKHLEVPLDSYVAQGLFKQSNKKLSRWISIKELKTEKSEQYQAFALEYANELKIARINLDLLFWQPSKRIS